MTQAWTARWRPLLLPTPPSLDEMEQHVLTLLTSASQLLAALSSVTPASGEEAKQHAATYLSTMQVSHSRITALSLHTLCLARCC